MTPVAPPSPSTDSSIQIGDHEYKTYSDSTITDRIIQEEKDIEEDAVTFYSSVKDYVWLISTLAKMASYFIGGIFDKGQSYDDFLDLMNTEFDLYSWISPSTQTILEDEKEVFFASAEYNRGYFIAKNYADFKIE